MANTNNVIKKCEGCGKDTRGVWRYKGVFYCYNCYAHIVATERPKDNIKKYPVRVVFKATHTARKALSENQSKKLKEIISSIDELTRKQAVIFK